MKIIDLRSDTLTAPTNSMRVAMSTAEVGDNVYDEDETVKKLESTVATLLGKEAALFMPSGCMSNQIGIKIHTNPGDEVIVCSESHIFHYETSAPSIISQVQLHPVTTSRGEFNCDDIISAVRPDVYYYPRTSLLCLENSHNRYGGAIISLENIREVSDCARELGLSLHCDGARLWNTCAETGIPPAEYAQYVDTLSVCLSKGLGAPVGSLLVGEEKHIKKAWHWRKLLGGGMRQVGVLAACGLVALDEVLPNLRNDHIRARIFAEILVNSGYYSVESVDTNIVVFQARNPNITPEKLISQAGEHSVRISGGRNGFVRAVFYHQIRDEESRQAAEILCEMIKN